MEQMSCYYCKINIQTNNQIKRSINGLNQMMTPTTRADFYNYPTIPKKKETRNYHNMAFKELKGIQTIFLGTL